VKWGTFTPFLNHALQDIQISGMNEIEIRKVQAYTGERSLTIVLPKIFSEKLSIDKGDFLKVQLEGSRLILEKADL
jgi:hypothetical protein